MTNKPKGLGTKDIVRALPKKLFLVQEAIVDVLDDLKTLEENDSVNRIKVVLRRCIAGIDLVKDIKLLQLRIHISAPLSPNTELRYR